MKVIQKVWQILNTQWTTPEIYGTFHIAAIVATVLATVLLCFLWKKGKIKNVRKVVLITAIIVGVLEIYKQVIYSFGYKNGIVFDYQWFIFPWQFCSTPLYIGLLAGVVKGKSHDNLCAYLATYALFAGTAVMLYPSDVFTTTVGICVQTMVCHGSMIVIGVFLYYTGYVKAELRTLWKAIPVFVMMLGIAVTLNEIAYVTGLLARETFNMFFVNPHCEPTLPVYSLVQNALMKYSWGFPVCLVIYVVGFAAAALVMLLIPMGIKKFNETDFDARYAEQDRIRAEEAAVRAEKKAAFEARVLEIELAKAEAEKLKKEKKRAEKLEKKEEKLKKKEAKESAEKIEKRKEKEERKKRKEEKRKARKEAKKKKREDKKAARKQKKKDKKAARKAERQEKKRIRKEESKAKRKAIKEKKKLERKEEKKLKKKNIREKIKAFFESLSKEKRAERRKARLEKERLEDEQRYKEKKRKAEEKRKEEKGIKDNEDIACYYDFDINSIKESEAEREEATIVPADEHVHSVKTSEGLKIITDENGVSILVGIGECKDVDVVIPATVSAIDSRAFEYCFNVRSVVVPEGVKTIGERAFNYCNSLECVTLPESLESIELGLLSECTSLRTIHYGGTKSQWRALKKGTYWNERTPEYIIRCFNGIVDK